MPTYEELRQVVVRLADPDGMLARAVTTTHNALVAQTVPTDSTLSSAEIIRWFAQVDHNLHVSCRGVPYSITQTMTMLRQFALNGQIWPFIVKLALTFEEGELLRPVVRLVYSAVQRDPQASIVEIVESVKQIVVSSPPRELESAHAQASAIRMIEVASA